MTDLRVLKLVDHTRTLVVELPEDTPLGLAEVTISVTPIEHKPAEPQEGLQTEREIVRARLRAAGFLVETKGPPPGSTLIEDADLPEIGRLPEGARPSEELIDEDRGAR